MTDSPRVLMDHDLDRRLQRDGFVTFPLVAAERVAALREEYGRLHGWDGSGFQSDLVVDDPGYRRQVSDVVGAALDDAATACFDGYRPFLHNFLCKFPGEESALYLHRDWMYVDERGGARTYVAWVALEDIEGHNGQLRVLRASHRIDPTLRGTALTAPWLEHEDVIEPRLISIPVKAGHAVVFDNALVHCSYPNLTSTPRVAAAIGFLPVDAPLVHYRRVDQSTAVRYDVDVDFFCTETPQGLMAAPPELPIAETIAIDAHDMTADELAARLDEGLHARSDRLQQHVVGTWRREQQRVRDARSRARDARSRARATRERASARVTERRARASARAGEIRQAVVKRKPDVASIRRWIADVPSKAAIRVLAVNEATIDRFGPDTPAVWDHHQFEWARRVEAAWPEVRTEVEALLVGPTEIPHIEDVTGGIPQGNVGPWRSFVLMHQGRWIDWNCERCPRTSELVRSIPGLTMAGFSVLEPGTHITTHRGPNKGALRYQLGVIVPGEDGDCRIRVGDEMLHWHDGDGLMFDFTFEHEAWNDSDAIRVLLMLEVLTPLPWYLAAPNSVAQHAMGWFPTTRDITNRLRQLEPTLQRGGSS